MQNLIACLQFITILPVGKTAEFNPGGIIRAFPLAGLVLGLIIALFDTVAIHVWPVPVVSVLDVVLLVILSGGFHMDGLADTADGLYGQRSREKALLIMKDSRVGAMGLCAVVCVFAVKWAGVGHLDQGRFLWLLIIPAYARSSMIFGIRYLSYARGKEGTGSRFFEQPVTGSHFMFMVIPVVLSLFLGMSGILLNIIFLLMNFVLIGYYRKKMGGITGDMLGAMTEVMEAGLFLVAAAGGVLC